MVAEVVAAAALVVGTASSSQSQHSHRAMGQRQPGAEAGDSSGYWKYKESRKQRQTQKKVAGFQSQRAEAAVPRGWQRFRELSSPKT